MSEIKIVKKFGSSIEDRLRKRSFIKKILRLYNFQIIGQIFLEVDIHILADLRMPVNISQSN